MMCNLSRFAMALNSAEPDLLLAVANLLVASKRHEQLRQSSADCDASIGAVLYDTVLQEDKARGLGPKAAPPPEPAAPAAPAPVAASA